MTQKRITPYQRLWSEFQKFKLKVFYPKSHFMGRYPKEKLSEGWSVADLWERTAAAETLGFDVVLLAKADGLHVHYVEKRPTDGR